MAADRGSQHNHVMRIHIGFLLYPDLTQLDVTGPYAVLGLLPDAKLHLVWKNLTPVRAYRGMCGVIRHVRAQIAMAQETGKLTL